MTATSEMSKGGARGIAVPSSRVETARITGTGLEVWEVWKSYLEMDQDRDRLRRAFDWLTDEQIDAALSYAVANIDAIMARVDEDYSYFPEQERTAI